MSKFPKVGVLALQGDFDAHRKRLEELGAEVVLVRNTEQLAAIDALVIPGGESTTILKSLEQRGFFGHLKDFARTRPTFGTCAGAILLAKEVVGPEQASLGALDMRVRRNAYGRQIESSIREGSLNGSQLEMVFIRAPKIEALGETVQVLAREGNDPVLVRQGSVLAATFHPELGADTQVHELFLKMAGQQA